ncbi:MAG: phosphate transport system ATP-binding protein [Candidatus Cloacimonadota bacterium]|nr:phosphate transport system ATP-binding protein [Candidatus Cloacimonadota bacterium]
MVKLQAQNLNLYFGKNHVLKDVNLDIQDKKITAMIGPSGCGKSTLLRTFNRMNDLIPDVKISGSVRLGENDIYAGKMDLYKLRAKIGMVFQKPNPFPKSIFKNVSFGLDIAGKHQKCEIADIVEESLKAVWLWDEVKNRLHCSAMSLSGGQQQRLCIARALANEPEVLLLDEPTSALDPQSTARIEELCLALKDRVSILIVTHNIAQAGRIADFTAFMYLGEMIEYAPTTKMFTVPQDKRTEAYLTGAFG